MDDDTWVTREELAVREPKPEGESAGEGDSPREEDPGAAETEGGELPGVG
jgi:hypothetical protein